MFFGTWRPGGAGLALSPDDVRHADGQRFGNSDPSARWRFEGETEALAAIGELVPHRAGASVTSITSDLSQLLERHHEDCFDRIEGSFALAVWDKRTDRLLLARDALGRRPLFCAAAGSNIVFGSNASQIAIAAGRPVADFDQLADFLLQRRGAGHRSFFAGVRRVPPGSCHVVDADGGRRDHRWWRPDLSPLALNDDALLGALGNELERSVGAIRARHPVLAAQLSAGLDSSLAVATLSRQLPPGGRLAALCASPRVPVASTGNLGIADEYPLAAETAAMLGNVDLERVFAPDDDWLAASDRFAAAAGMPYRNPANLGWLGATYATARASGAETVVESVQGNLTVGYTGSGAVPTMIAKGRIGALASLIDDVRRHGLGTGLLTVPWALFAMLPAHVADPLAAFARTADPAAAAFVRANHSAVGIVRREIRANGGWWRQSRPLRYPRDRIAQLDWADHGAHAGAVEQLFGIELADPYADRRLVELTLRIDEPRFLHKGRGRGFARRLLEGRVPARVAAGTTIWAQGSDWRIGAIRSRATVLSDLEYAADEPALAAFFDVPRLRAAVNGWASGPEDFQSLETAGSVMRAIGAIRFVRWVATLGEAS